MADTEKRKPIFATPAEAVACLRGYLDDVTGPMFAPGSGVSTDAAYAALESLEAALSTERESNTANMAELHRADARIGEQAARIRALESELTEKTARVTAQDQEWDELAAALLGEGDTDATPERMLAAALKTRTPVELDRGEAVAGELAGPIDVIRLHAAEADLQDSPELAEQLRTVCDAAERWSALQWREPSAAPVNQRLLVLTKHGEVGITTVHSSLGADYSFVGWLPLDALPALPSEPAALVEYANAEGGHDPGCDCALHKNGTPVALDRGEASPGDSNDLLDAIETVANMAEDIDFAASDAEAIDAVCAAARSWAALQWREPRTLSDGRSLTPGVRMQRDYYRLGAAYRARFP
jgi:hypothetical protein